MMPSHRHRPLAWIGVLAPAAGLPFYLPGQDRSKTLTVGRAGAAPQIDGRIDDACWQAVRFGWTPGPEEGDRPAVVLFDGGSAIYSQKGMLRVTLPRHGNRPNPAPKVFPPNGDLPGSTQIVYADGHAGAVKLEQLWSLTWHNNWVEPAKRPGK